MGLTQSEANSTLRLSLGKLSTLSDVAIAADAIAYAADASKIIL
jgi:cysteine sulfinate desulfinase/cysteine desulfurase-like protein